MSLFSAIKSGLAKTRETLLGEFKSIAGVGRITDEMLEHLEEHLIKADVGVEAAFLLTDALREHGLGKSLKQSEINLILRNEAERLLIDPPEFILKDKPRVVLIIGVNGAGKTTTIGKLAHRLKQEGKSVLLAAGDTFRAAAIEQLETWAQRSGADFVRHQENSDPSAVAYDACKAAIARESDIVFIDTAGRLHNKDHLMEELHKTVRVVKKVNENFPHDIWLVIDGNSGQNVIKQVQTFHQNFKLTGLIVTKLDGTAKGGSVLSIASELKIPILWIGVGEKIEQLVPFDKTEYINGLFEDSPIEG
jgi:fused signal recognition particle receptor